MNSSLPLGVYIHFPFCQRKCAYCDFPSYAGQESRREDYIQVLLTEIRERSRQTGSLTVDTVFLGGGTPTVMEARQVAAVLTTLRAAYDVLPEAEITCEINPGSLRTDFLMMLKDQGVNRLSFGAQSADEAELRLLDRVHTWEEVVYSVEMAREAGFHNINLDLMTALPGQGEDSLMKTIRAALALEPSHLSCYSLIIEEGTPFHQLLARGELALPEEEAERAMYWNTAALLAQHGYEHYEISNFALPGRRCRHNENTWRYRDYLGFGASAAGLYRNRRRKNPDDLFDYLKGEPPLIEDLQPRDTQFEQLMLALRLREGLSLAAFKARQGLLPRAIWPREIQRHIKGGLLEETGGYLRLTDRGYDLMDMVLLDFLPA